MRALVSSWIVAGVLVGGAAPGTAEERALLVGVDKNHAPVPTLPGIDKDLATMKETARHMGFGAAQIRIVTGSEATKAGILKAVDEWLVNGVGPNDRALFYYSGHGTRIRDLDGDEADGMDEALVPADVAKGPRGWENVLLDDEFGPILRRIPSRQVLALIDACHSGTMTRSLATDAVSKFVSLDDFSEDAMGKALEDGAAVDGDVAKALEMNMVIVSAANEKQAARATPNGSVFTLALSDVVDYALKEHLPLSANDIREATDSIITRVFQSRPQLAHTPTVDGNPKLAAKNLLASRVAPAPAPAATAAPRPTSATVAAAPTPTPAPAPAPAPSAPVTADVDEGASWKQLDEIARKAKYKVAVRPGRGSYHVGQNLDLEIDVTQDGYLNVLNVGAGEDKPVVLFPNQFHPDNAVKAGTKVTIPGAGAPFKLPASLPAGASEQRTLVLVTLSPKPLNAFKSASGTGFIRELSAGATRAFTVEAATPQVGGYGAAQVVVVVRK